MLLSSASLKSKYVAAEVGYALSRAAQNPRSNIIPVVIETFASGSIPSALGFMLSNIQWLTCTTGPLEERVAAVIHSLKTREME